MASSWLFVRRGESIWIERVLRTHGHTLIVAGPGPFREQRDFLNDQALEAFQIATAERLAEEGWLLWDFDRERRQQEDRRRVRRGPDRRQPLSRMELL